MTSTLPPSDADLLVKSLAAQDGVDAGASVNPGALIASEGVNTAQLDSEGVVTANSQEIDLKVLPMREIIQAASDTLTADECRNTIISNYGQAVANTQQLPAPEAGMFLLAVAVSTGTGAFSFKPPSGHALVVDGTVYAADHKVSLATPSAYNMAAFYPITGSSGALVWFVDTKLGVWTDGGA